jgi:hypothetical protein
LKTGDGRSFPQQVIREIRREAKLLGMIMRTLKEVDAEIAGMIRDARKRRHPAQRGQSHPIAKRLADIRGVGQQTAGIALGAGPAGPGEPSPPGTGQDGAVGKPVDLKQIGRELNVR